jgi:nucleotide-binding universal stress UspA family protein
MYKRILIPLDGSKRAERVLPYVLFLAPVIGAEVQFLRVAHPTAVFMDGMETYISAELYQQVLDADVQAASDYLEGVASQLRGAGIKANTEVVFAQPASAIIDAASAVKDTLVMMSTHGRTGLSRFALGSVAELVVRETATPVFLVRGLEDRPCTFDSILVPLDGSTTAEAVLPCVEAIAPALKSKVFLLRVPANEDASDACDYLAAIATRLRAAGIKAVHTAVRPGPPDEAILTMAERENVSFIAMATHGRSGVRRWVLGSVADRVLHMAPIPTLLVRGEEGPSA